MAAPCDGQRTRNSQGVDPFVTTLRCRAWGNFYRHAWGAKRVFARLDTYVWWTIFRWLKKRHPQTALRRLFARYGRRNPSGWRDGRHTCFTMARLTVEQFKMGWLRPPRFAEPPVEIPVRIERRTPGSARGTRKPAGESR